MLIDKLPWCKHQGSGSIFSIHVHPKGTRFATAGVDHTVRIWNLLPALDARQENNEATHKLLATLNDHTGPVNIVRFSHCGRYVASGSDDSAAIIYEHRAGQGGAVLGGESNIDNWRTKHLLRGHSSHIVDLAWSPDNSRLAVASLDTRVSIWDTSTGNRVGVLSHHTSFVKGLAWDPVGTYLATQSEDKSIAIWRTDDWTLIASIKAPFKRMVTATFGTRMSWSPDGTFLLAGNSFQGATHAAIIVPREKWDHPEDYLLVSGHAGAVVSTSVSPKLMHLPSVKSTPENAENNGENGQPNAPTDATEELSAIFALGGQDKRVTVWAQAAERPIFCGQRLFKSQVLDICWTPDGNTLLAASADGTVSCFQFEPSEIGKAATTEEMTAVMKGIYGSATGRTQKRIFAESVEQLDLERQVEAEQGTARVEAITVKPAPVRKKIAPLQVETTGAGGSAATGAGPANSGTMAALETRLGGSAAPGATTHTGFGAAPDKKRSADADLMPPPPPRTGSGAIVPSTDAAAQLAKRPRAAYALLPFPKPSAGLTVSLGNVSPIINPNRRSKSAPSVQYELQITNVERGPIHGKPHAQICLVHREQGKSDKVTAAWSDILANTHVIAAAGNTSFVAVATLDGHVVIYTPHGRRTAPPLKIGAAIAILSASRVDDSVSKLLIVSTTGTVKVIDPITLNHILSADISCLLESGVGVLDIRMSSTIGSPIVTLSNSSAYVWHQGLESWVQVANDALAQSRFAPVPQSSGQGELAHVQSSALVGNQSGFAPSVMGTSRGAAAAVVQQQVFRGVAETNLGAAEALGSADEYKNWLTTYARTLSEAGDDGRLQELCDEFMGGLADSYDTCTVLGMSKRELLRNVILREMARNRALGTLLQRCRLALDEIEAADA